MIKNEDATRPGEIFFAPGLLYGCFLFFGQIGRTTRREEVEACLFDITCKGASTGASLAIRLIIETKASRLATLRRHQRAYSGMLEVSRRVAISNGFQ